MAALLTRAWRRRALLQALVALPAFSLFRSVEKPVQDDETVEVEGWILKRSDLA